MRLETFSRILKAMRPAHDRMAAEAELVHAMRVYRDKGHAEGAEQLLDAAGAFYGRFSQYCLDAHREDVYRLLMNAWHGTAVAYEEVDEEIVDRAFQLYSIACTHRIVVS